MCVNLVKLEKFCKISITNICFDTDENEPFKVCYKSLAPYKYSIWISYSQPREASRSPTQMFHVDKGQLFDQISQFALAICVFRNVGTHFERFSTNFREVGIENYRTLALSVDLLAI